MSQKNRIFLFCVTRRGQGAAARGGTNQKGVPLMRHALCDDRSYCAGLSASALTISVMGAGLNSTRPSFMSSVEASASAVT